VNWPGDLDLERLDPDSLDARTLVWRLVGYVPVTVVAIALLCWALAANGVRFEDVFRLRLWNPLVYVLNGVFHSDWGHFAGNMRLWIPLGAVLTWLTSNRHVLGLAVTAQVLATVVSLAIGQFGVGLSAVVLAVGAATLVKATGVAMGDASATAVQITVAGVFAPALVGFLLVAILAGPATEIGHFAHFFGFLYGGAIEAMYVFSAAQPEDDGRRIPEHLGR